MNQDSVTHLTQYTLTEALVIDAGAGNDTIYSSGDAVSISGGAGDDSINGGVGSDIGGTINAGTGNDTISLDGKKLIQYAAGDGNDVVTNYYRNYINSSLSYQDTIQVTNGDFSFSASGDDVVMNVRSGSNSGTITLKNAVNGVINVLDSNGNITRSVYDNLTGKLSDVFVPQGEYNNGDIAATVYSSSSNNGEFIVRAVRPRPLGLGM